jgi:ABC-type sugar transport system permease subunit
MVAAVRAAVPQHAPLFRQVRGGRRVSTAHKPSHSFMYYVRKYYAPFVFILPVALVFIVLMAVPMVNAIRLSLERWDGVTPATWAGVDNYARLGNDPYFWAALKNTLIYALVTVVFFATFPLLAANILNSGIKGSTFFRTTFFVPVIISLAISGLLFSIIYEPNFGILNEALRKIGLGKLTQLWLADRKTVLPSIIAVALWRSFGFFMVIFFAGLQGIPQELYESAQIDGANAWQRLVKITVPLLAPVTTVVVVLQTINSVKVFDLPWVMTAGGPNHMSETLGTYLYVQAFGALGSSNPRLGYASAIGFVILLLAFVLSLVQIRWGRSEEIEY